MRGDGDESELLCDLAAERAVLAAVLIDDGTQAVLPRVRAILAGAEDFYDPRHGIVWAGMLALADQSERIDVVTLAGALRAMSRLNTLGGAQYLDDLTDRLPTTAHCEQHARLVADAAAARRCREALHAGLALLARGGAAAVPDALSKVASVRLARRGRATRTMDEVVESAWGQVFDALEGGRRPVPTGFRGLDGDERSEGLFAGGLHRRELVVVAADQGGGKTAWATQVGLYAARERLSVLFVSQEMSAEELMWRVACGKAGVPGSRVRAGRLSQDELSRLQTASRELVDLDVRVCDAGCSAADVRLAALASGAERPLHLVIVDYLQILDPPAGADESKTAELIDANARAMKCLARELDCPVVLLSQFNRAGQLAARKPRIQDLKGSGGIESHADIVVVLYPAEGRGDGPAAPEVDVDLLVLKQRNGPTGEVRLRFERKFTRFVEPDIEGCLAPTGDDEEEERV